MKLCRYRGCCTSKYMCKYTASLYGITQQSVQSSNYQMVSEIISVIPTDRPGHFNRHRVPADGTGTPVAAHS